VASILGVLHLRAAICAQGGVRRHYGPLSRPHFRRPDDEPCITRHGDRRRVHAVKTRKRRQRRREAMDKLRYRTFRPFDFYNDPVRSVEHPPGQFQGSSKPVDGGAEADSLYGTPALNPDPGPSRCACHEQKLPAAGMSRQHRLAGNGRGFRGIVRLCLRSCPSGNALPRAANSGGRKGWSCRNRAPLFGSG